MQRPGSSQRATAPVAGHPGRAPVAAGPAVVPCAAPAGLQGATSDLVWHPARIQGEMGLGAAGGACVRGVCRIRAAQGWISVDRGGKATLPLTVPRHVFKSSAKDSARRPSGIALQGSHPRPIRRGRPALGTSPSGPWAPTAGREANGGLGRRFTSLDSGLEAFSHNPAHGSFAPLAFQPSAMTNCVNQRFLSY